MGFKLCEDFPPTGGTFLLNGKLVIMMTIELVFLKMFEQASGEEIANDRMLLA